MTRYRAPLLLAVLALAATPAAGGAEEPRAGTWAISGAYAWGFLSPDDLNRRIELDDLLFATSVPTFDGENRVSAELRRGLTNALALGLTFGYTWQTERDGQVTREIDSFPLTVALAYYPPWQSWLTWNVVASGGFYVEARASGDDPLGGFSASGSGPILAGGLELETFLSKNWSARIRGTLQWAEVKDVPSPGETLDLSGEEIQLGLRVYIR